MHDVSSQFCGLHRPYFGAAFASPEDVRGTNNAVYPALLFPAPDRVSAEVYACRFVASGSRMKSTNARSFGGRCSRAG